MLKIRKSGFLMIEVLISLIVFSMVTIALFTLQVKSTASVSNNASRGVAISFANEIFDKMRANKTAFYAGSYLTFAGGASTVSMADNGCKAVNYNIAHTQVTCSSVQMAQDDLQEFQREVSSVLPQGNFIICKDSTRSKGTPTNPNCDDLGTDYIVKIYWKDRSSKDLNTNEGFAQVIVGAQI